MRDLYLIAGPYGGFKVLTNAQPGEVILVGDKKAQYLVSLGDTATFIED